MEKKKLKNTNPRTLTVYHQACETQICCYELLEVGSSQIFPDRFQNRFQNLHGVSTENFVALMDFALVSVFEACHSEYLHTLKNCFFGTTGCFFDCQILQSRSEHNQ